ncbi:MAG: ABC transporter substrate-binding protein [Dethiobacteria bacterium]|jgi:iron complex transport system substrate-binding protein
MKGKVIIHRKKAGLWSRCLCWFLFFCLAVSLLTAGGCAQPASPGQPLNNGEPADSTTQQIETRTVVDCAGREVQIPASIERIACLCPEAGHAMAMLGVGDRIVAAVGGMQRDLLLVEMCPQIANVPVPKSSGVINIEELLNCEPDVVFVKEDTAQNEAEMEKMNKTKVPFLVVEYASIEKQQCAVEMMGTVVGNPEKAKRYNEYYQDCIKHVQKQIAEIPLEERVTVYHSVNEAVRTDVEGTLPAEWTRLAGAVNVSLDKELKQQGGKCYVSLEQILLWDPEVILVNDPLVADYIMSNKQWAPLQAVKNNKVWRLPNGISRWGHPSSLETPLAILWTAWKLYPDKFTDIDLVQETKYFYEEFFNYRLTDVEVKKILSGTGMRDPKN